jgi:DNA-binding MarR family transcriptional regulator
MAETDTPSKRGGNALQSGEILPDFADLVVGMSRLLLGLGNIEPFQSAGFGLADWVALSVLAKGPAQNNRQLAKVLGVTRQRANQIKTSLERAKLISSTQSSEDARQNVITLTARGQAQLDETNGKILAILSSALKNKKRVVVKANNSIRVLMRIVRANKDAPRKARSGRAKGRRRRMAARSVRADI